MRCAEALEGFENVQVKVEKEATVAAVEEGAGGNEACADQLCSSVGKKVSNEFKFDPLSRKKGTSGQRDRRTDDKKDATQRRQGGKLEEDIVGLMQELLSGEQGELGDGDTGTETGASMRATLEALASQQQDTLGGHEEEGEEDSLPSGMSSSLVDSIMQQLLSKEVLYQPMKDIGERYPSWLEENKDKVSSQELHMYQKQYEYIQKICSLYESDPGNFDKLMKLLQEVRR